MPGHGPLPGSGAAQQTHQEPEIVAGDMEKISFVNVLAAAQPGPPHAAAIKDMGEAPFDNLGAEFEGFLGDAGQQSVAVVVDRPAGGILAVPARKQQKTSEG